MEGIVSPKIAFIFPCANHQAYAPCLRFNAVNNVVNLIVCTGFIGFPSSQHQYVCTLNIFNPDGVDLLQDESSDFPALFPIDPNVIHKDAGITFVKSEANIIANELGIYHIICTLYSQGFGEKLHFNESWFHVGLKVDVK
ncbi:hypothetical protein MOR33_004443 [Salmonella enterica]|nr:hypothetical protein [Salmonella enterica]EGL7480150.1 hypothetical protein [Salmonella enterica]EIZ2335430.1 hypothetical protein [Salmonella enterica]